MNHLTTLIQVNNYTQSLDQNNKSIGQGTATFKFSKKGIQYAQIQFLAYRSAVQQTLATASQSGTSLLIDASVRVYRQEGNPNPTLQFVVHSAIPMSVSQVPVQPPMPYPMQPPMIYPTQPQYPLPQAQVPVPVAANNGFVQSNGTNQIPF